jgi:acylphosphatase
LHVKQHRIRLLAYGAVQGVGFRDFVRRTALSLDLYGYVRNRQDGAVEVEATGDLAALERLREAVGRGPAHASVERVEEQPPTSGILPHPFAITW